MLRLPLHGRHRVGELWRLCRRLLLKLFQLELPLPDVGEGDGLDAVVVGHVAVPVELGVRLVRALRALVLLRKVINWYSGTVGDIRVYLILVVLQCSVGKWVGFTFIFDT